MNLPGFSAEESLYQTNGQYRTGRNSYAIHLAARMTETIHPAREVIEVHGCAPGSGLVEYDDGTWECVADADLGWGGGQGAASGGGGEPGGGGGAGRPSKKPPKRPPRPSKPKKKVYAPTQGAPCHAELIETSSGDVVFTEQITSKGDYIEIGPSDPQPGWHCAYTDPGGPREAHCNEVKVEGGRTKRIACYNGHDKEW